MASGFRRLPSGLRDQIDEIGNVPFRFGAVRAYSPEQEANWVTALELEDIADDAWQGIPPARTGLWSRWNITGRQIVRKDLPKVSRSWTIDAPDFQGGGTHPITFTKPVFQKQRLYGAQIEASVTHIHESKDLLVGSVLKELEGPFDPASEAEYLYAASLCRTWFGSVQLFTLDAEGVPEIPEQHFGWTFLPDGTLEEIRAAVEKRFGSRATPREVEIMIDRLQKVESLRPEKMLVGETGLQKYIGYQFGDDFVAFENPRVGNALYLLFGDWQALSQLSRTELLSGRFGNDFDRIIHSARWFDALRKAVYSYRNT